MVLVIIVQNKGLRLHYTNASQGPPATILSNIVLSSFILYINGEYPAATAEAMFILMTQQITIKLNYEIIQSAVSFYQC